MTTTRKLPKSKRTITVSTPLFVHMLTDLVRFASPDKTLPMINAVRLHSAVLQGGGVLVGTATDRFKLAQTHTAGEGALPDSLVRLADCKRALTVLKGYSGPGDLLTLVQDGPTLTLNHTAVTLRFDLLAVDFPKVERLLADDTNPSSEQRITLRAEHLGAFTAVSARRREPMRVRLQGERKPTLIQIGDTFRGLVMVVRPPDEGVRDVPVFLSHAEQAKARDKRAARQAKAANKAAAA